MDVKSDVWIACSLYNYKAVIFQKTIGESILIKVSDSSDQSGFPRISNQGFRFHEAVIYYKSISQSILLKDAFFQSGFPIISNQGFRFPEAVIYCKSNS